MKSPTTMHWSVLEGMPCDDAKAWVFVMFKLSVKSLFLKCVRASSFDGIGDALPKAECMLPMRTPRPESLCLKRASVRGHDKFCHGIPWGMTSFLMVFRGGR